MQDKVGMLRRRGKRIWDFFWHEDSLWSWLANIVVAFLVIRYLIYPVLGIVLGTSYPIVAVVSESMEHGLYNGVMCGKSLPDFKESFDNYWEVCGEWYEQKGITQEQFKAFPFKNGFNKGDVIILWKANKANLEVGDILVFRGNRPQPIIHRIVDISDSGNEYYIQTKGDHNSKSIEGGMGETHIIEERIVGKGVLRLPYLGWVKILFVDAVRPLGINIQR